MSHPLNILPETTDEPWYKDGLHFECTGCGRCCTGAPGYVWVSEDEILAMAQLLNLSLDEFGRHYLRQINGRYALLERAVSTTEYDCIFLKDNKCSVYSVRPKQCRTFPWWQQNLTSKEDWLAAASYCEGISEKAPHVQFTAIKEQLT